MRDATKYQVLIYHLSNFNPRVPCGTRRVPISPKLRVKISIHASHAGRDKRSICIRAIDYRFQSTRPMRDATVAGVELLKWYSDFNPRVPCGTRRQPLWAWPHAFNFNPRVPCGTRHQRLRRRAHSPIFQSTRPMRDATAIYTNSSRFLRLFLCYRNTILRY